MAAKQVLTPMAASAYTHEKCHIHPWRQMVTPTKYVAKTSVAGIAPTDAAWACPMNAAHRFFKVNVEKPGWGRRKENTAVKTDCDIM